MVELAPHMPKAAHGRSPLGSLSQRERAGEREESYILTYVSA